MSLKCYNCEQELVLNQNESISRTEECSKCYANIRSCRMCSFYDTTAYNDCRESAADRILEKEKANFCDYYKIGTGDIYKSQKEDLLSKADSLFKN